ncbi:MAG: hypothetical protein ACK4FR_13435 [Tabrizicola sp.]
MSEYTDYMIYQTSARGLEQLRAEVAALAPPGTVIYPLTTGTGDGPDAAAARLTGAPVWVALMSPELSAGFNPSRGGKLASIQVLEDFASWRIEARCGGQEPVVLYLGGPDGYAADWFGYNDPGFKSLTSALTSAEVTALQACFDLPAAELVPLMAYGRVWDFLTAIDAPSMQMADQGLIAPEDFPDTLPIAFAWELWPETYDQDM